MKRSHRGLEREAHDHQTEAGEQQRVAEHAPRELVGRHRGRDALKLGRAGRAVDQRQPVDERGRPDRADHEVLQSGLERSLAPGLGCAQHVQRDRQQFDSDEQRDEVLRRDEDRHPEHAEDQQPVVLALPSLTRGDTPPGQDHGRDRRGVEDKVEHEREVVDPQRARDDRGVVVEVRDRVTHGAGERHERQQRHDPLADHRGANQADHQHDEPADGQDQQRGEPHPVDMRALQVMGRCGERDRHLEAVLTGWIWVAAMVALTLVSVRLSTNCG